MAIKQTLDSRISSALSASGEADRGTLVALHNEALDAIEAAQSVIEAETPRLHDLSNETPDKSLQLIESNKLRIERYNKAIDELGPRIDAIDRATTLAEWTEEHNKLQDKTAALADEFRAKYPTLRAELIYLFLRLDDNRAAIDNLCRKRPPGGPHELVEAELIARGLSMFTIHQPRLRDSLRLPAFADPFNIFPRDEYAELMRATALQTSEMVRAMELRRAATGMYSGDWWQAQKLAAAQQEAENEKREAELAAKADQERQNYYASLQEADRKRIRGEQL